MHRSAFALALVFAFAAPFPCASLASAVSSPFYDEVFDEEGRVRPHVQKAFGVYRKMSERDRQMFIDGSRQDFLKDNALNPFPRVLTESEFALLKKETENRGTAIRMLLEEYYSGGDSFEKVIPREDLERIIERNGETRWRKAFLSSAVGKAARKQGAKSPFPMRFNYGPDIIRARDGSFHVLEDNPGYIGGPGDFVKARQTLLKWAPEYKQALEFRDDPEGYYPGLAEVYRKLGKKKEGRIVAYQIPPYPDNEDIRIKALHKKVGIETVTPNSKAKLRVGKNHVFLETPMPDGTVKREKVSFLVLNGEHSDLDSKHPLNYEKALLLEAEGHLEEKDIPEELRQKIKAAMTKDAKGRIDAPKLRKILDKSPYGVDLDKLIQSQVEGLTEAILAGKVQTNYTPGLDFIGDKEFNMIVDDLYRHYLKREPRLTNVPTFNLGRKDKKANEGTVDEKTWAKVLASPNDYVIKTKDGRGGDGVWVLAKISHDEIPELERRIRENPLNFIAQKYIPLSQMLDQLTDLRMISYVHEDGVYVPRIFWSRSIPANGNGKVNISDLGLEAAGVIVKDPKPSPKGRRVRSPSAESVPVSGCAHVLCDLFGRGCKPY